MDESSQRKPEQDLPVNSDQEQSPLIESDAPVSSPSFSRKIIIAIGAVAILAVIGWVFIAIQQSPQTTQPVIEPSVPAATTTPELSVEEEIAFQTQADELIAAGDLTRCEEIDNGMYRAVCINNIALTQAQETGDITLCERMDGEFMTQETCEQSVLAQLAPLTDNDSFCEKATLPTVVKTCKNTFAYKTALQNNDVAQCEALLPDTEAKDRCVDDVLFASLSAATTSTGILGFDCMRFSSTDARQDCKAYKSLNPVTASSEVQPGEFCGQVRSQIFLDFCLYQTQRQGDYFENANELSRSYD